MLRSHFRGILHGLLYCFGYTRCSPLLRNTLLLSSVYPPPSFLLLLLLLGFLEALLFADATSVVPSASRRAFGVVFSFPSFPLESSFCSHTADGNQDRWPRRNDSPFFFLPETRSALPHSSSGSSLCSVPSSLLAGSLVPCPSSSSTSSQGSFRPSSHRSFPPASSSLALPPGLETPRILQPLSALPSVQAQRQRKGRGAPTAGTREDAGTGRQSRPSIVCCETRRGHHAHVARQTRSCFLRFFPAVLFSSLRPGRKSKLARGSNNCLRPTISCCSSSPLCVPYAHLPPGATVACLLLSSLASSSCSSSFLSSRSLVLWLTEEGNEDLSGLVRGLSDSTNFGLSSLCSPPRTALRSPFPSSSSSSSAQAPNRDSSFHTVQHRNEERSPSELEEPCRAHFKLRDGEKSPWAGQRDAGGAPEGSSPYKLPGDFGGERTETERAHFVSGLNRSEPAGSSPLYGAPLRADCASQVLAGDNENEPLTSEFSTDEEDDRNSSVRCTEDGFEDGGKREATRAGSSWQGAQEKRQENGGEEEERTHRLASLRTRVGDTTRRSSDDFARSSLCEEHEKHGVSGDRAVENRLRQTLHGRGGEGKAEGGREKRDESRGASWRKRRRVSDGVLFSALPPPLSGTRRSRHGEGSSSLTPSGLLFPSTESTSSERDLLREETAQRLHASDSDVATDQETEARPPVQVQSAGWLGEDRDDRSGIERSAGPADGHGASRDENEETFQANCLQREGPERVRVGGVCPDVRREEESPLRTPTREPTFHDCARAAACSILIRGLRSSPGKSPPFAPLLRARAIRALLLMATTSHSPPTTRTAPPPAPLVFLRSSVRPFPALLRRGSCGEPVDAVETWEDSNRVRHGERPDDRSKEAHVSGSGVSSAVSPLRSSSSFLLSHMIREGMLSALVPVLVYKLDDQERDQNKRTLLYSKTPPRNSWRSWVWRSAERREEGEDEDRRDFREKGLRKVQHAGDLKDDPACPCCSREGSKSAEHEEEEEADLAHQARLDALKLLGFLLLHTPEGRERACATPGLREALVRLSQDEGRKEEEEVVSRAEEIEGSAEGQKREAGREAAQSKADSKEESVVGCRVEGRASDTETDRADEGVSRNQNASSRTDVADGEEETAGTFPPPTTPTSLGSSSTSVFPSLGQDQVETRRHGRRSGGCASAAEGRLPRDHSDEASRVRFVEQTQTEGAGETDEEDERVAALATSTTPAITTRPDSIEPSGEEESALGHPLASLPSSDAVLKTASLRERTEIEAGAEEEEEDGTGSSTLEGCQGIIRKTDEVVRDETEEMRKGGDRDEDQEARESGVGPGSAAGQAGHREEDQGGLGLTSNSEATGTLRREDRATGGEEETPERQEGTAVVQDTDTGPLRKTLSDAGRPEEAEKIFRDQGREREDDQPDALLEAAKETSEEVMEDRNDGGPLCEKEHLEENSRKESSFVSSPTETEHAARAQEKTAPLYRGITRKCLQTRPGEKTGDDEGLVTLAFPGTTNTTQQPRPACERRPCGRHENNRSLARAILRLLDSKAEQNPRPVFCENRARGVDAEGAVRLQRRGKTEDACRHARDTLPHARSEWCKRAPEFTLMREETGGQGRETSGQVSQGLHVSGKKKGTQRRQAREGDPGAPTLDACPEGTSPEHHNDEKQHVLFSSCSSSFFGRLGSRLARGPDWVSSVGSLLWRAIGNKPCRVFYEKRKRGVSEGRQDLPGVRRKSPEAAGKTSRAETSRRQARVPRFVWLPVFVSSNRSLTADSVLSALGTVEFGDDVVDRLRAWVRGAHREEDADSERPGREAEANSSVIGGTEDIPGESVGSQEDTEGANKGGSPGDSKPFEGGGGAGRGLEEAQRDCSSEERMKKILEKRSYRQIRSKRGPAAEVEKEEGGGAVKVERLSESSSATEEEDENAPEQNTFPLKKNAPDEASLVADDSESSRRKKKLQESSPPLERDPEATSPLGVTVVGPPEPCEKSSFPDACSFEEPADCLQEAHLQCTSIQTCCEMKGTRGQHSDLGKEGPVARAERAESARRGEKYGGMNEGQERRRRMGATEFLKPLTVSSEEEEQQSMRQFLETQLSKVSVFVSELRDGELMIEEGDEAGTFRGGDAAGSTGEWALLGVYVKPPDEDVDEKDANDVCKRPRSYSCHVSISPSLCSRLSASSSSLSSVSSSRPSTSPSSPSSAPVDVFFLFRGPGVSSALSRCSAYLSSPHSSSSEGGTESPASAANPLREEAASLKSGGRNSGPPSLAPGCLRTAGYRMLLSAAKSAHSGVRAGALSAILEIFRTSAVESMTAEAFSDAALSLEVSEEKDYGSDESSPGKMNEGSGRDSAVGGQSIMAKNSAPRPSGPGVDMEEEEARGGIEEEPCRGVCDGRYRQSGANTSGLGVLPRHREEPESSRMRGRLALVDLLADALVAPYHAESSDEWRRSVRGNDAPCREKTHRQRHFLRWFKTSYTSCQNTGGEKAEGNNMRTKASTRPAGEDPSVGESERAALEILYRICLLSDAWVEDVLQRHVGLYFALKLLSEKLRAHSTLPVTSSPWSLSTPSRAQTPPRVPRQQITPDQGHGAPPHYDDQKSLHVDPQGQHEREGGGFPHQAEKHHILYSSSSSSAPVIPPSLRHARASKRIARRLRLVEILKAALGFQEVKGQADAWPTSTPRGSLSRRPEEAACESRRRRRRGLRILSFDGGGTRGVLSLALLKILMDRLGLGGGCHHVYEVFDIICGTSTGGVLAVLLGLERASVAETERLYDLLIREIFVKDSPAVTAARLVLRQAAYDERSWEEILERAWGQTRMIDFAGDPTAPKVFCLSTIATPSPTEVMVWRNYNYPMRLVEVCSSPSRPSFGEKRKSSLRMSGGSHREQTEEESDKGEPRRGAAERGLLKALFPVFFSARREEKEQTSDQPSGGQERQDARTRQQESVGPTTSAPSYQAGPPKATTMTTTASLLPRLRSFFLPPFRRVFQLLFRSASRVSAPLSPPLYHSPVSSSVSSSRSSSAPGLSAPSFLLLPSTRGSRHDGSFRVAVKDALRATTAAPGYFAGVKLEDQPYSDGALLANNPTAVAIAEARALYGDDVPIDLVVSIGTGRFPSSPFTSMRKSREQRRRWSVCLDNDYDSPGRRQGEDYFSTSTAWGSKKDRGKRDHASSGHSSSSSGGEGGGGGGGGALSLLGLGGWETLLGQLANCATNTEAIHGVLAELLDEGTYFRFNPEVPGDWPIDETSTERLDRLKQVATEYFEDPRNERRLVQVVEKLRKGGKRWSGGGVPGVVERAPLASHQYGAERRSGEAEEREQDEEVETAQSREGGTDIPPAAFLKKQSPGKESEEEQEGPELLQERKDDEDASWLQVGGKGAEEDNIENERYGRARQQQSTTFLDALKRLSLWPKRRTMHIPDSVSFGSRERNAGLRQDLHQRRSLSQKAGEGKEHSDGCRTFLEKSEVLGDMSGRQPDPSSSADMAGKEREQGSYSSAPHSPARPLRSSEDTPRSQASCDGAGSTSNTLQSSFITVRLPFPFFSRAALTSSSPSSLPPPPRPPRGPPVSSRPQNSPCAPTPASVVSAALTRIGRARYRNKQPRRSLWAWFSSISRKRRTTRASQLCGRETDTQTQEGILDLLFGCPSTLADLPIGKVSERDTSSPSGLRETKTGSGYESRSTSNAFTALSVGVEKSSSSSDQIPHEKRRLPKSGSSERYPGPLEQQETLAPATGVRVVLQTIHAHLQAENSDT